ncbi:hypothetical protein C2I18_17240 [Paenibacillus sp. PK3_47]|uniref:hypothetical protein n=1 Tax=Paenibacillus sp. PK3_47 TaxID=2072642 RepID=UPI00201DAD00|nr:hypothetical protein [Paenibacillus sp. PK3_47]UQZ35118.1 hypothetical protein C2I18_17240 [Paenibacillus sp. PK3_47]
MEIIDMTLVALEAAAVVIFAAYVIRYRKYFIGHGPERTYNLYLRSVWVTYSAVVLLCLNLLWGRLNIVFGYNMDSLSNTLREFVMILTLVILVYAGLTHKDIWDSSRHKDDR